MGCKNCIGEKTEEAKIEFNDSSQSNQKPRNLRAKRKGLEKSDSSQNIKEINKVENSIKVNFMIHALCFIKDNELAIGLENGFIQVFDLDKKALSYELNSHEGIIKDIIKLEDGRLVSASGDKTIKVWRLYEKMLDREFKYHTGWVNCLLQPKSNSEYLISGGSDNMIKVINIKSLENEEIGTINVESNVDCLCDLKDGNFAANSGDSIKIFNLANLQEVFTIDGSHSSITSLCMLGAKNLISCTSDGKIKWYDANYKKAGKINGNEEINKMIISEDGLVITTITNGIKFIDINSQKVIKNLPGHEGKVFAMAFNEAGTLVTGGEDKAIRIWGA